MNLEREVVTRAEAGIMFGIPEREFTLWLSEDAAKDWDNGKSDIPPMPHYPGSPTMFPIKRLREWREKYFLAGWKGKEAA